MASVVNPLMNRRGLDVECIVQVKLGCFPSCRENQFEMLSNNVVCADFAFQLALGWPLCNKFSAAKNSDQGRSRSSSFHFTFDAYVPPLGFILTSINRPCQTTCKGIRGTHLNIPLVRFTYSVQVYSKSRPGRPERRHTTATGVLSPSQDNELGRFPSPAAVPVHHANTEPARHDLEEAITLDVPPARITSSPNQVEQLRVEPEAKKTGFLASKISKFRRRRHHPLTEQAYKKTFWENLKAIIFSSWVNVLLVFVPVV
jgi:hypothetical protein